MCLLASSRLQLRAIIQHSLEFNPGHLTHYLSSNRAFGLYGNKHIAGNIDTHLQMDRLSLEGSLPLLKMPFVTEDLADIRTPTRHLESALTSHWSRTHRALTKRPQSHDWVVNSQAGLHPWAWHKQPTRSYKQDKVAITFHANIKLATVCFVPVLTALCELPAAISNAKESKARLLFRRKRQLKNNRKSL